MSSLIRRLGAVADEVLTRMNEMPSDEVQKMLVMQDYHGFAKARFPDEFLAEVVGLFGFGAEQVQLEVVRVSHDLKSEVHIHRESCAYVWCLGRPHFPEATRAMAFARGRWHDIYSGEQSAIPAGTPHGFTVKSGGTLHFLSVQSPPIVRADGRDDYERVGAAAR